MSAREQGLSSYAVTKIEELGYWFYLQMSATLLWIGLLGKSTGPKSMESNSDGLYYGVGTYGRGRKNPAIMRAFVGMTEAFRLKEVKENGHAGEVTRSQMLNEARKVARVLSAKTDEPLARVEACLELLSDSPAEEQFCSFRESLLELSIEERHYWIGTLYTLMLPAARRRAQATYFTPPEVARAVVDLVVEAGFDIRSGKVLDPAAGGAAFLSTLAGRMKRAGVESEDILSRLDGIEIDEALTRLSHRLIEERLEVELFREVVRTGDALVTRPEKTYDLVIANPPYGRVPSDQLSGEQWRRIAYAGHVNKYALFAELSFRRTKPGGLVALVIPSSFKAGPLYDRFREFVRAASEVIAIASVEGRDGVFIDVVQDISVLVARKGKSHKAESKVQFPVIGSALTSSVVGEGCLPVAAGAAWAVPATDCSSIGGATLDDYGVEAKAGYFVWNREKDRMIKEGEDPIAYPLIWARNVQRDKLCRPVGKDGGSTDFVKFERASEAILRKPAAVMQRTTNDKQPRRLIAAMMDPGVVAEWGGFVTENHTIVLTANDRERLELVVGLLNTAAVDSRYRRVSGTASVSVLLLRELDLPRPDAFEAALDAKDGDVEAAAEVAYLAGQDKTEV